MGITLWETAAKNSWCPVTGKKEKCAAVRLHHRLRLYLCERKKVGMTQASKSPAELNIARYRKKGGNILAVQVFQWHDGSYLEDQDFFPISDIESYVFLYALTKFSIWISF